MAFCLVPELKGAPVSGVTRWLSPDKALLQLGLRFHSDDQFWFSFFHEAGHLLRHGKQLVFLEDGEGDERVEAEADAFARHFLIPREHEDGLQGLRTEAEIRAFAGRLGIAPGIIVGRLQHDGLLPHRFGHRIKRRWAWRRVH